MEFWVAGNVGVRQMWFHKAGEVVDGHEHNFDHVTYIVRGTVRVERLGAPTKFDGDGRPVEWVVEKSIEKRALDGHNWILIKAGVRHRLTAMEDNSLGHCIYSHRTPQGDVVQEYDGWSPAYL